MAHASRLRRIAPLVVLLLLPTCLMASWWHESKYSRGRKYKPPPATAKITVTVMSEQFHKPIKDASVVFHSKRNNRPDGYMELKTNPKGKATISVVPIGDTLVLQVIARDYQTFGQVYKIKKARRHITVMLLPPQKQFSDYKSLPRGDIGIGGKGTTEPHHHKKSTSSTSSKSSTGKH